MNSNFVKPFGENINFSYTCFDRVVIRGYIKRLFWEAGLVFFLRAMGFKKTSSKVMRILTDQLNAHIKKESDRTGIPILWWSSVDGGKNGDKHKYVEKQYVKDAQGKGDFVYCIITDTETAMSYAARELKTRKGKEYWRVYK